MVGVVVCRVIGFDGDMNLAGSKGSVGGFLAGVVTEGASGVEMESWPALSRNCQVSGTTMKTKSCASCGGWTMMRWSRKPATFPVQDNKTFDWKWVSFLSAIFLQSVFQGFVWMGKITKT